MGSNYNDSSNKFRKYPAGGFRNEGNDSDYVSADRYGRLPGGTLSAGRNGRNLPEGGFREEKSMENLPGRGMESGRKNRKLPEGGFRDTYKTRNVPVGGFRNGK